MPKLDRTFDRPFDYVTHQSESGFGYPPNIQKTEDYKLIEMGLAGFDKKDIEIEVAEGVLTVKSLKDKDTGATDDHTLYGISQRNFTRKHLLMTSL